MMVKLWPNLGQGGGPLRGALGFNFFHSHLEACNSNKSLLYFPYSTIPPKTRMRVPSTTNPKAAQPGGMSPLTGGTNHWFVAVLYTCSSSTIPSLPPPNTTMRSLIATALCPCLGL